MIPPQQKANTKKTARRKESSCFLCGGRLAVYGVSILSVPAAPAGQGAYSPNRSRAISASRWAEPSMPNWLELSIRWQLTYSSPPP